MGRATAILLLLLLAAAGSGPAAERAAANVFEVDDRIPVERRPGTPWAAVGLITQTTPGRDFRYGTVTLVGPCHALTAHHTAFRRIAEAGPAQTSALWFGPPKDGFPWTWRVEGRPVAWGDLGDHVHADWALLELETCLGAELGWWELAPLDFAAARARGPKGLMSLGHPVAAPRERALLDPGCGVYSEAGRVPGWRMDCAVRVGNSGGPVFLALPPGREPETVPPGAAAAAETGSEVGTVPPADRPQLVAIVKGDFFPQGEGVVIPRWDPRAANVALPVRAFLEALQPHLAAGLARAAREAEAPTPPISPAPPAPPAAAGE